MLMPTYVIFFNLIHDYIFYSLSIYSPMYIRVCLLHISLFCLYTYVSINLLIHNLLILNLSIKTYIHKSINTRLINLFISLSIHQAFYPYPYLLIKLSIYQAVYLTIHPIIYSFILLFIYL